MDRIEKPRSCLSGIREGDDGRAGCRLMHLATGSDIASEELNMDQDGKRPIPLSILARHDARCISFSNSAIGPV